MRLRLGDVVGPGTVCRAFEKKRGELTWDDLELLATIEDFSRDQENGPNDDQVVEVEAG